MKRYQLVGWGLAAVSSLLGCGDNVIGEQLCGVGTVFDAEARQCVPEGAAPMCTNGTILDAGTNSCVIDPNACQDGTVLVMNQCVDPGKVSADITEAPEPNGLGLFGEDSQGIPAGIIGLKAVGEHFVFSGKIEPHPDSDGDNQLEPDVDSYTVTVQAPTLISVSADGLHGLAAGFLAVANVAPTDPLDLWVRAGINLTGDTSKRQLFLPAAGTYIIAIADTRTVFLTGGAAGAEPMKPAFEYYVTVDQLTATPTVLTPTAGVATSTGNLAPGEVKLFTVAMGLGINQLELSGGAADAPQSTASLVVTSTTGSVTKTKLIADEAIDNNGTADESDDVVIPPGGFAAGFRAGDTTTIVADHIFNWASGPLDYDLTVLTGGAAPLSTSGATASQPATTDFSAFFYDVSASQEITGMDLSFDTDVSGVVVDENLTIFSFFTFDPTATAFCGDPFCFGDTFSTYTGLLRHRTPGRYYFLVFDPSATATMITATSSYAPTTAAVITKGTVLPAQAVNAFEANPFTYAAGTTDAWQEFNAIGTATGNLTARYYNPTTAFGRLDNGDAGNSDNTCVPFCNDFAPIFSTTHVEAGTVRGRVLLDDPTQSFLVTVNTATVTGSPTFDLDFKTRVHTDLMSIAGGTTATRADEALDTAGNAVRRYLFRTSTNNKVTITVHPDGATDDNQFQLLNIDESPRGAAINNGAAGVDDSGTFTQGGNGWTAFTVASAIGPVATTFDLSVQATTPPYGITTGNTAYSDACTGGQLVTLTDTDDGLSTATVSSPTGFDYFTVAAPSFTISSNGWLSFDAVTGSAFSNVDMPNAAAPNSVIAPYWDDLDTIVVCTKTTGTKLNIQWVGTKFGTSSVVQMQIILDGADDTIEFVYSSAQTALTGASATIGVENQGGTDAVKVGFNTAGVIVPGTSKKFTPQ